MPALGLLFKWLNVGIIGGYLIYQIILKIVPNIHKHLAERRRNRLERLAALVSFDQKHLEVTAALEQQHILIEQLSAKIAQWHSYEMEAKKKLQTYHSKIYHDAKNRIECQTHFLKQRSMLLTSVDTLLEATKQELCIIMNQQEQSKYRCAVINKLKKESHGL